MSRLDELIKELCPDGVEYKTLRECTEKIQNIKWKDYSGDDKKYIDLGSVDRDYHCITETQNINADSAPSRAQQIVQTNDILLGTTRPMLKRYCMISEEYDGDICSTGFCVLRVKEDIVRTRWVYHNIATNNFFSYVEQNQKGASYPAISDAMVKAFRIPVPPLEVQNEIVRILDNFTELTDELTAKLTAELTARQKQYEFYRDKLLDFGVLGGGASECVWKTIGELCNVAAGGDAPKDNMSKEKTEEYTVPIISNGIGENALYGYTNTAKICTPAVTVAARGTIGYAAYRDYPFFPIIRLLTAIPNNTDVLDTKFLYYTLQGKKYNIPVSGIPQLTAPELKKIKIAVPKLSIQKRIVHVLDNFDAICSDLNIGLPAEIEARQKQYEYYRDMLLTFAESGNTISRAEQSRAEQSRAEQSRAERSN